MVSKLITNVAAESWPIAGTFRIARGAKTVAEVVTVTISDGEHTGCGECVPYARYGEAVDTTIKQIRSTLARLGSDLDRVTLNEVLPAGAARNALDCALWDLQAKQSGQPVWTLAGVAPPRPCVTAFTISLDTPDQMAQQARRHPDKTLLKLKLGDANPQTDITRLHAVRTAAPNADLIVDANESWTFAGLQQIAPVAAQLGVQLLEQPLPADADESLTGFVSPVPLGADESVHDSDNLAALVEKYQVINIKLDKTGGLTHALELQRAAARLGMKQMIGCMVATSLSMAPALLLAARATFADLDGPLLLVKDRSPGLVYNNATVSWPLQPFWGTPAENT